MNPPKCDSNFVLQLNAGQGKAYRKHHEILSKMILYITAMLPGMLQRPGTTE
jgi:hypothetical protein